MGSQSSEGEVERWSVVIGLDSKVRHLRGLIEEGLASGESVPVTPALLRELRQRALGGAQRDPSLPSNG
jgi:hypothetical protein